MPHVRAQEYVVLSEEYQLVYIEAIQRHHKRTPYASNVFPKEDGKVSQAALRCSLTDAVGVCGRRTVCACALAEPHINAGLLAEHEWDCEPV